jgi:hypothetical protein
MTFEEQFPSLTAEDGTQTEANYGEKQFYSEEAIQKTCLDKQKVREAILFHVSNSSGDVEKRMLQLLKELGL